MTFYLLYLCAACITSFLWRFLNNKGRRLFIICILLVPVLFATFRNGVGTDYYVYLGHISKYGNMTPLEYIGNNSLEIGHYILLKVAYIVNNEYLFFFLYSFLTVLFGYLAISSDELKSKNGLSWFVFLLFIFPISFNIMKQALAVSIILFSYKYLLRKDFKRFSIFVVLASMFHLSALIFLPCYFLPKVIRGKKQLLITILIILFSFIFTLRFNSVLGKVTSLSLFNEYSSLLEYNKVRSSFNNYQKYISFFMLITSIVLYKYYKTKNDFPLFIILILVLELSGVLLGDHSPYLKRISLYFTAFYPVIFNQFRLCFRRNGSRLIVNCAIIAFAIFWYTYSYII